MPERFVIPDDLARAAAREGRDDWLARLPALVARIAADWQIEIGDPFLPGGATAWVAPARDKAGKNFVLKVGWPHPEAAHEADGLRTWDGAGAITLCQVSDLAEATVLLLERCRPGTQLRASPPEEHDLVIAGLLRRLWMKPPRGHGFRPLSDMCDYWANRYEERSPAERSCLKAPLAKEGIGELPRSSGDALLLHTDLHAGNVLAAEREPWLAIDPKPYVGDPAYDVTQHIFNRGVPRGGRRRCPRLPDGAPARSRSQPDPALALCPRCRGVAVLGRNGRTWPRPSTHPDLSGMQQRTRR